MRGRGGWKTLYLTAAATTTLITQSPLALLLPLQVVSSFASLSSTQRSIPTSPQTSRAMSSEVVPADTTDGGAKSPSQEETILSWRSRLEVSMAKSRKIRGSNYVQLATVDPLVQEPRCRTVVFRGFLPDTLTRTLPSDHLLAKSRCDDKCTVMKMCTDARSQKVAEQQQAQPSSALKTAELVWWFPKTSEQYRVRGKLLLIGDSNQNKEEDDDDDDRALIIARKELWGNLSDPARESFLDPLTPGAPYDDGGGADAEATKSGISKGGRDKDGKVLPPPSNFLLMLLDPFYVDYLNLTGEQYRQMDRRDGTTDGWSQQRVNP